jgi:hypothetical protein
MHARGMHARGVQINHKCPHGWSICRDLSYGIRVFALRDKRSLSAAVDDETHMPTMWLVTCRPRDTSFVLNNTGTRHPRRDIQVPCISDALNSFISRRTCSGPSSSMEHDVQLFRGKRPSPPQFQCDDFYTDSRQRPSAPDMLDG